LNLLPNRRAVVPGSAYPALHSTRGDQALSSVFGLLISPERREETFFKGLDL